MYTYLLAGVIAGIAASVLYISGTVGSSLSLLLYFLAPLPLFIAGLGWGAVAAATGAVAGAVVCILVAGPLGGILFLASIGIIPTILSHYALLSQPADAGATDAGADVSSQGDGQTSQRNWYPLGYLVLWTSGLTTLLTAIFILFIMPSTPELKTALESLLRELFRQNPDLSDRFGGEITMQQTIRIFIAVLPAVMAGYSFVTAIANLWLASKILDASGRALRPTFDLTTLYYPAITPLILGGGLILAFIPGVVGKIALAGTMALSLPFMILGLIVLHAIIPNSGVRFPILAMVYLAIIILFSFAYLALSLVGVAETIFGLRHRYAAPTRPGDPGAPPSPGNY